MQQKGIFMAENHKKNPSFFYKMRDFFTSIQYYLYVSYGY